MRLLKYAFFVLNMVTLQTFADDGSRFNMTRGVTSLSRDIYDLHMIIFWICVVIGFSVFAVLIYAMVRHRKTAERQAAKFHSSFKVELLWTIIPFLILTAMAIPATIVLMRMEDSSKAEVNIKVTGYQWKWQYEYLDYGISFFSNLSTPQEQIQEEAKKGQWYLLEVDKPLVVPIHKKIRFLVTSNDVIHSWWVPALGIKRDAIPGFIHEAWAKIDKPGIYRGQCAELCGVNHAYMPIVVQAVPEAEFDKWVASQSTSNISSAVSGSAVAVANAPQAQAVQPAADLTKDELMDQGKAVFEQNCSICHQSNGQGMPPAVPALAGSVVVNGPIDANLAIVIQGKSGTAMQAFGKQLSPKEIAAVVTYVRNGWGNGQVKWGKYSGGVIQPAYVLKIEESTPNVQPKSKGN